MQRSTTPRGHGGTGDAAGQFEGCFQSPTAVLPGPLGQGLAVVAGVGQDEGQALRSLLGQLLHGCLAERLPGKGIGGGYRFLRRV